MNHHANARNSFRSRREAAQAAREYLWGDVPLSRRACLYPEQGAYGIYVAANVNGRLVVFDFDNYGRVTNTIATDGWTGGDK